MDKKNIELELRAAVSRRFYNGILAKLKKKARLISHTKRLSVMYFGKIGGKSFDIRVRITNGKPEVVIKKGKLHAHDRIEISSPITRQQFIKMVELFELFDFKTEVAKRETYNFNIKDNIVFSIVKADNIFYIEAEKMTSKQDIIKDKKQLINIFKEYRLKPVTSEREFNKICDELSKYSDWPFNGSKSDYEKLKKLLGKY